MLLYWVSQPDAVLPTMDVHFFFLIVDLLPPTLLSFQGDFLSIISLSYFHWTRSVDDRVHSLLHCYWCTPFASAFWLWVWIQLMSTKICINFIRPWIKEHEKKIGWKNSRAILNFPSSKKNKRKFSRRNQFCNVAWEQTIPSQEKSNSEPECLASLSIAGFNFNLILLAAYLHV